MTKSRSTFALMVLLHSLVVFAQDVPPTTAEQPSSQDPELIVGKPIRWRWPDGRQAILVETFSGPKDLTTGLTMTKNTCNPSATAKCYFKSKLRQQTFGILWEKNPKDPSKVGKPLLRSVGSNDRYANRRSETEIYYYEVQNITGLSQLLNRNLYQKSPQFSEVRDSIICENYDWMPKSSNGDYLVESWLTQFEFPAGELAMGHGSFPSANQFITSAHEVKLEIMNNNELQIVDAKAIGRLFNFGTTSLSLGYQTVMNFDRDRVGVRPHSSQGREEWSDPQCRIEMTINFSELFTNFTRLNEREFPRPTVKNSRPVLFQRNNQNLFESIQMLNGGLYQ